MNVESWEIGRLVEYANNPRKNDHAVAEVAAAIRKFGFRVPILARSTGEIIDGHLRYKAARHAGIESVPVLVADDMSEDEVRAFRISVNKVAELAKWDVALLEQELRSLRDIDFDLSDMGFSEVALDEILNPSLKGGGADPDAVPEVDEFVSEPGDLWLLGDHRLLVGDACEEGCYRRLLAGGEADMVWTDPPYNVDYSGKAGKIKNDKMSEQVFSEFLAAFYGRCFAHLKVGGPIYVAHADGEPSFTFRQEFRQAGFKYATCLIWRKNQATLGRSDYQYQHEPILYGWKPGGGHCWYGGRKKKSIAGFGDPPLFSRQEDGSWHIRYGEELLVISGTDVKVASLVPSIISIEKPLRSALHPTMKPVALIEHYLLNSSRPGDIVLDPFGGSGSTLIACERRGRCCRTIELDPRFADVIVRRWQEFTGRQAALEDGRTLADLEAQRGVHAG